MGRLELHRQPSKFGFALAAVEKTFELARFVEQQEWSVPMAER
jgi:hypothetical protein